MSYSVEVIRRVFDDEGEVCIDIGGCGIPGVVSIYTEGEKNTKWYGKLYLGISPGHARLRASAILARADEAEKEDEK